MPEDHESASSGNSAVDSARETAGESKEITGLLEVRESDFSTKGGAAVAAATAGESDRNLGSRQVTESHSRHNSSWGVDVVACRAQVNPISGRVYLPSAAESWVPVCLVSSMPG